MEVKRPQVKKVANAKVRKKTQMQKLADVFVPEDIHQVKRHILLDLIVPRLKIGIVDIFKALVMGETTSSNSRTPNTNGGKVSYKSYYEEKKERPMTKSSGPIFDDVILDSREDADLVLQQVGDIISEYGCCSVLSLYDIVGINSKYSQWTLQKYGWTSIDTATIEEIDTSDGPGYLIDLPKAIPLQ